MLPAAMRRLPAALLCLLAATVAPLALGACGEEEPETEVVEGEPLELGDLSYNIQLTRFLNPDDNEDAEYLVGQSPPEPGTEYLGVFMVIENESDELQASASEFLVHDTLENQYEPLESESPYALDIGADVPGDGALPLPDTTAESGPNQGSLVIFAVDDSVSENRPLKLEVGSVEGVGEVILDI
jgi:hypothetical protein